MAIYYVVHNQFDRRPVFCIYLMNIIFNSQSFIEQVFGEELNGICFITCLLRIR